MTRLFIFSFKNKDDCTWVDACYPRLSVTQTCIHGRSRFDVIQAPSTPLTLVREFWLRFITMQLKNASYGPVCKVQSFEYLCFKTKNKYLNSKILFQSAEILHIERSYFERPEMLNPVMSDLQISKRKRCLSMLSSELGMSGYNTSSFVQDN